VKVHLKSILRKIKLQNRTQAAVWAIQQGFMNHVKQNGHIAADAASLSLGQGGAEFLQRRDLPAAPERTHNV
jgi:hypothetical protein